MGQHNAGFVHENVSVEAIADQLLDIAGEIRQSTMKEPAEPRERDCSASLTRRLYSQRRLIDQVFDMQGFACSPCWDMLLDLSQANHERKRLSVSSVCIGAGCASTTALRWLGIMEGMGLVTRVPDTHDQRRYWVVTTDIGNQKVREVLRQF